MTHKQAYQTATARLIETQDQCSNEEILPFEMGYLPIYFQKKAEIELHESPENKEKGLRWIKEMVRSDHNFNGQTFDDDFLVHFLRSRKYDVARAFKNLKSFVIMRRKQKEMFNNIKFESIAMVVQHNVLTFLPRRCHDGCAIILMELENWDPEQVSIDNLKRAALILIAQSLRDPMSQVNGYKVIFNVKGNPVKYIRYCTLSNMRLLYQGPEECSAARFKEIHLVNQSLILTIALNIIKPFLSKKMKQRIIFHAAPDTLSKYFSRSVLPIEYGGDLAQHDITEWLRKAMQPEKLVTVCGTRPSMLGKR